MFENAFNNIDKSLRDDEGMAEPPRLSRRLFTLSQAALA